VTDQPRSEGVPVITDFPHRLADNVRFADLDINQHVNNAVYSTYFESSRVLIVKDPANGLMPAGLGYVLVRLDIHFRAELHWPGTIEIGLGVEKLGRTSVTFAQAVFSEGKCIASAKAITVMIDQASRKPVALPPDVVQNFQRWKLNFRGGL
jgi:acyl-CoA thioester hydrolase